MMIETLNLTHFGPFHNQQLELQPGINIIYGENEAGKTTLHQFIQAMLFGVERLRGKAARKDDYSRFQPWEQGKNYEGSMVIVHNGEKYRLLRNFYKEDEFFKVEQMGTGREILLPGGQIDGLIEGMTRANYKNALSICQLEHQIDARFGLSLQAYMANLKRTKSEDIDLQQTLDYLRKERKIQMDKSPEKQLQALKDQAEGMQVTEAEKQQLFQEIRRQEEKLRSIREQMTSERLSGRENRKKEQKERMEAIRLIEENNYIASRYQQKKAAYEEMKQQSAEDDFDTMKQRWDAANEAYDDISDRYEQLMGRNLSILFSVMMFGLIPVIGVFFLKNALLPRVGVILLLVIVLAVTGLVLQGGRRKMGRRVSERKQELDEIHDVMEQHMFGRGTRGSLKELQKELRALREQYEKIQIPLQPYLEKYGDDISLEIDTEAEDGKLEELRAQEENLTKSLERLMVRKETMERKEEERTALEEQMEALAQEAGDDREEIAVIDECMAIIRDLSEEIHSGFGPALNQEVSRMMWELTGGKYERVVVDNELNLKVDTGRQFAEADQLSTGTREQLYLTLRMAMVRLLFPESSVPVFFDDSFVFYDDRRLTRTLAWLAKQNLPQVVIFTCQHREMDALDRMGIPYNPVYLSA